MSERKTTEIKLRVTPDEKARWQTEAERQGIALSELIRQTINSVCAQAARLAAASYAESYPRWSLPVLVDERMPRGYAAIKNLTDASPQEDVQPATRSVGTSDEVGSVEPWMFEARQDG